MVFSQECWTWGAASDPGVGLISIHWTEFIMSTRDFNFNWPIFLVFKRMEGNAQVLIFNFDLTCHQTMLTGGDFADT